MYRPFFHPLLNGAILFPLSFSPRCPPISGTACWVSVIVVALQIFTGALLAYAMVFLEFKGRERFYLLIVMGTYMLPVAATYIPSYIILSKWNLLNTIDRPGDLQHSQYLWNFPAASGIYAGAKGTD